MNNNITTKNMSNKKIAKKRNRNNKSYAKKALYATNEEVEQALDSAISKDTKSLYFELDASFFEKYALDNNKDIFQKYNDLTEDIMDELIENVNGAIHTIMEHGLIKNLGNHCVKEYHSCSKGSHYLISNDRDCYYCLEYDNEEKRYNMAQYTHEEYKKMKRCASHHDYNPTVTIGELLKK